MQTHETNQSLRSNQKTETNTRKHKPEPRHTQTHATKTLHVDSKHTPSPAHKLTKNNNDNN